MRRLVRNDVVRERGEHETARNRVAGGFALRVKPSEREPALVAIVVRVALEHAERTHVKPRPLFAFGRRAGPREIAAERAPECGVGEHADGIHHLQMKLSVRRRRRETAREQQRRLIEIERIRGQRLRDLATLDVEQPALGTRLELFVWNVDRGHAAEAIGDRRIEREDAERSHGRTATA